jgi:hypothetical protein
VIANTTNPFCAVADKERVEAINDTCTYLSRRSVTDPEVGQN